MRRHACSRETHRRLTGLIAMLAFAATAIVTAEATEPVRAGVSPQDPVAGQVRAAATAGDRFTVEGLAIGGDQSVDVQLERLTVVSPKTRFVIGSAGGDRPWAYDPERVSTYRGTVADRPGSHVFLAVTASGATGYVDLGDDRHWISTRPRPAASSPKALPPGIGLCGREGGPPIDDPPAQAGLAGAPASSMRVVELAIETDFELYELIGDPDEAFDYIVELYAAISDIYIRDVNSRFVLTFVRIWDTPDDLFNEPNPLGPFVEYWNENMTDVDRDLAQFFSGRRDLPYGGVAYLGALCSNFGYSVVGYALGFFPDVNGPSIYHFDIPVAAHELGHNFDAQHTHTYGLDNCNQLNNTPQRGTIMSYCSQTVSGGNAVTDLRFHTVAQADMRGHVTGAECADADCNGNGLEDFQEILDGLADDENGNGVPDACEDCNGNGVLDDADIDGALSDDVNDNGVPDECEVDCNANGMPDDFDIFMGLSEDLFGNGVPDECEIDCDGSGVSDYNEIQADLSLDVNRDAVLDACQDCDGDGTIDRDALEAANDVWIASHDGDEVIRGFQSLTGVLVRTSDANQVDEGNDLVISADARVFVASGADDRIAEFSRFGGYVGDFVASGAGGLDEPAGLAFGLDGNLYVTSRGSHAVLRYDRDTGNSIDAFVPSGSGGLTAPFGLAFGPDGLLYVNGGDDQVRRYDGLTGAFVDVFVTAPGNGGLDTPRGMAFKTSGNLLVASHATNEILEYDALTGNFVGKFNKGGTDTALTFDGPWGLRVGPSGNLFASRHLVPTQGEGGGLLGDDIAELHVNSSRIYEFHIDTGIFLRSYVTGNDTDLWTPTGFDFLPDFGIDCNLNALPDSCDIASGFSIDANGNGVPDECEGAAPSADLNGDGLVDGVDLGILLGNWYGSGIGDLNGDGIIDGADLGLLLAAWGPVDP